MNRLAVLATLLLLGSTTVGSAAGLLEKNFWLSGPNYHGQVPYCGDPSVEDKIRSRFSHREAEFWGSDLKIGEIYKTREIALEPWGEDFIPRRFCAARVDMSDGKKRSLYYEIAEDQGIIGATWGVRWCITGLDRSNAFAPDCTMAQP